MNLTINPKYKQISDFINSIPQIFETRGTSIYKARNELKTYEIGGYDIVVKCFRKPHFINQFVYGFFRPSKARRSYEYALELLKRGINTPEPIAYIEEKKFGLLTNSYYLCVYERDFSEIRQEMLGVRGDTLFLKALAAFIADTQNKGVLQQDLSPGNILSKIENGQTIFTLVDINRTKFMPQIPKKERYKNFERIAEKNEIIDTLATEYAKIMSYNTEESKKEIHKYIAGYSKNYHIINSK